MGTPGMPASVNRSRWLNAAAWIRTRTSPGPGVGSGISTNDEPVGAAVFREAEPAHGPLLASGVPAGAGRVVLEDDPRGPELVTDTVRFREIAPRPGTRSRLDRNLDRAGQHLAGTGRAAGEKSENLLPPPERPVELAEGVPGETLEAAEVLGQCLAPPEQKGDRFPRVEILGQGRVERFDQVLGGLGPIRRELRSGSILAAASQQLPNAVGRSGEPGVRLASLFEAPPGTNSSGLR